VPLGVGVEHTIRSNNAGAMGVGVGVTIWGLNAGALGPGVGLRLRSSNPGGLGPGADFEVWLPEAAVGTGVDYESGEIGQFKHFGTTDLAVDADGADLITRVGPFTGKIIPTGPRIIVGYHWYVIGGGSFVDDEGNDLTQVDVGRTNKVVVWGTDYTNGTYRRVTPNDEIVDSDGTSLI
jgi:hypothetical protein